MTLPVPPGSRTHSAQGETRNGERRLDDVARTSGRPGAGRTPPRVRHATENAGLGCWRKTQFGQGLGPQATQRARRRTHSALGLAPLLKSRLGGWQKTQLGQGVIPGRLLRGKNGGERSPSRGELRCNGKRPVCRRRRLTGACETCGAANLVQKAAPQSGGEAVGRCLRSNRSGKRPRSVSAASPVGPDG